MGCCLVVADQVWLLLIRWWLAGSLSPTLMFCCVAQSLPFHAPVNDPCHGCLCDLCCATVRQHEPARPCFTSLSGCLSVALGEHAIMCLSD